MEDFIEIPQSRFEEIKKECRKEGAVEELKKTIKELEDSLEFYECDYCKFEQHVVDKIMEELTEHINKLNKRLKELKGVN